MELLGAICTTSTHLVTFAVAIFGAGLGIGIITAAFLLRSPK